MKYIFDIESLPNYFLGMFLNMDTWEIIDFQHWKSRNQIPKMLNFLDSLGEDDEVITWNGWYYDFLLIEKMREGVIQTHEDCYNFGQDNIFGIDRSEQMPERATLNEFPLKYIDLMELFNLKQSLKKTAAYLHYEQVQDFPIEPGTVINLAQKKALYEYCKVDLKATAHIYREGGAEKEMATRSFLIEKYGLQPKHITLGRPRIAVRALSQMWRDKWNDYPPSPDYPVVSQDFIFENLIDPRINFKTEELQDVLQQVKSFRRAQDEKAFKLQFEFGGEGKTYTLGEGGIHDDFGARVYHSSKTHTCLDIDVSSYYPTLMLNLGLLPRHLKPGGIKEMVENIVDDRLQFKAEGKKVYSDALKIVINSLYGLMGNKYSFMYDPHMKLAVCLNGQLYLLMLIERLHLAGCETVYANTDGILSFVNNDLRETLEDVVQKWSRRFNLGVDILPWEKVYCLNVNDYFWQNGNYTKGKKTFATQPGVSNKLNAPAVAEAVVYSISTGRDPEDYYEKLINEQEDGWKQFLYVGAPTKKYLINKFDIDGAVGATLSKTVRYFHALDGGKLYKENQNTGGTTMYPHAESVRILNKLDEKFFRKHVNLWPYVLEAEKLMRKLQGVDE